MRDTGYEMRDMGYEMRDAGNLELLTLNRYSPPPPPF